MKNNGIHAGAEGIDRVFRAIGDPHRIRIIGLLREKELSAGEILQSTDVVQSTLSHHMKTLTDSGAVNAVRRGKCTCYSLNGETFARLGAFFEDCANGTSVMKADLISRDAAGSGRAKAPAEDAGKEPAETASGKTAKSDG